MKIDFDSLKPIYIQVSEGLIEDILLGRLKENEPVYSQLVLAKELGINPATAAKGIHVLVQKGILEKQRGQSMIVAEGARAKLAEEKREKSFQMLAEEFVAEAKKLNIPEKEVISFIQAYFKE